MSRLSRILKRVDKAIAGHKETIFDKLGEAYDETIEAVKDVFNYYEIKQFLKNLPHFVKQAWYWRSWDSAYSIECFCQNLERLGRSLRDVDRHTTAQHQYKRCMTAAWMLRKAYADDKHTDKSVRKWWGNNKPVWREISNSELVQLDYRRKYSKEYSEKMYKVITKRLDAIETQRKQDAWTYIHKHIEQFWD